MPTGQAVLAGAREALPALLAVRAEGEAAPVSVPPGGRAEEAAAPAELAEREAAVVLRRLAAGTVVLLRAWAAYRVLAAWGPPVEQKPWMRQGQAARVAWETQGPRGVPGAPLTEPPHRQGQSRQPAWLREAARR